MEGGDLPNPADGPTGQKAMRMDLRARFCCIVVPCHAKWKSPAVRGSGVECGDCDDCIAAGAVVVPVEGMGCRIPDKSGGGARRGRAGSQDMAGG